MLSREYIHFLESLPCNRHARRRSRPVGQWLSGWVPEHTTEPISNYTTDQEVIMKQLLG
jgi:hypothetical protein